MTSRSSTARMVVFTVFLMIVALVTANASATTTFNPLPSGRSNTGTSAGVPKTCTTFGSGAPGNPCISGGIFLDGNPSFAVGFNSGTGTSYQYASWAADRGSGNETLPLVPYSAAGCSASANPEKNVPITAYSTTQTTVAASASPTGTDGIKYLPSNPTDKTVLPEVHTVTSATKISGTTVQFTVGSKYGGPVNPSDPVLTVGHVWRISGVTCPTCGAGKNLIYDGDWTITNVVNANTFQVDLGVTPAVNGTVSAGDSEARFRATSAPVTEGSFDNTAGANIDGVTYSGSVAIVSLTKPMPGAGGGVAVGDWVTLEGITVNGVQSATYNSGGGGFQVVSVDSPKTIQVQLGGAPTAPADDYTGIMYVRRGTYTWAGGGQPFIAGDAIKTQAGGATWGLAWKSPGTGAYQAYTVQDVVSGATNKVSVNIGDMDDAVTGGSGNVFLNEMTVTTATAHNLQPGAIATITGTGDKAVGRWPVRALGSPAATVFKVSIDTFSNGSPSGNSGFSAQPPYCEGVYFARSATNGATWETPIQMNEPTNLHGEFYTLAASGPNVYVVYAPTVGYYNQMCASAPRPMYIKYSHNYGAAGSWSAPILLTAADSRIGYPTIAADGDNVYVATSETPSGLNPVGASGSVSVWRNSAAGAAGSWVKETVGATTSTSDWGYKPTGCPTPDTTVMGFEPMPGLGAAGNAVGVIFARNNTGKAVIKVSTDYGDNWSQACPSTNCIQNATVAGVKGTWTNTARSCPGGGGSTDPEIAGACGFGILAAAGGGGSTNPRLAFAWTDTTCLASAPFPALCTGRGKRPPGVYTKVWTPSGFQATRQIACFEASLGSCIGKGAGTFYAATYMDGYNQQISWFGGNRGTEAPTGLAVTWEACPTGPTIGCNESAADQGGEIVMKESTTMGSTWGGDWGTAANYKLVADNNNAAWQVNEYPQVIYYDPSTTAGATDNSCDIVEATGRTATTCKKVTYFMSRNTAYTIYRLQSSTGSIAYP